MPSPLLTDIQRAKLDDVARLAGVSRSTASRAINGGARVSPSAQAAVDQAIAQLGFIPNRAARALVTNRTDSVALVIPEPDELVLSDPFIGAVLRGVSAELHDTTTQLVLLIARPDEEQRKLATYLRQGHVDGAIVASHHRGDQNLAALDDSNLPHVYIGRPWAISDRVAYVDVDGVAAARTATERLIADGCRRIGHIAGPADMMAGSDRLTGFREAMGDAGLRADAYVHGDFTAVGGEKAARTLFTEHPDVDGLFVASDTMALAAIKVASQLGKRVPQDLKVVGFDDLGAAADANPPLTTMVNPVVAMAEIACRLLAEQIANRGTAPHPVILPSRLITRASA